MESDASGFSREALTDLLSTELFADFPEFAAANGPVASSLSDYAALLTQRNEVMNLTAITDTYAVATLHLLDSLTLLPLCERLGLEAGTDLKVADIGSGAGLPGIPLAIMRPEWRIDLLDALEKRVRFLKETVTELGLRRVRAFHLRAEDAGRDEAFRGRYDLVTARALANLTTLAEYGLPLLKTGGVMIAMKAHAAEELRAAETALRRLGGEVVEAREFILKGTEQTRCLVAIHKTWATPSGFPRAQAQIKRKPL